jgi:nitrate reductase gamma subunit
MNELINYIVFGWYPYLCLTVFLLGSVLRFDREQYTWRSGSSQLLRRRQLMWGSNLFHVGVLIIFLGHFGGLLTPIWIFEALGISHTFKQWMAIIVGGVSGIFAFIGLTLLVHRRLFDARIRTTSSFGDIAILLILYVQLTLGLATIPVSLGHLDGHMMVNFMNWAQGILRLQPGISALILDVPLIFKLHLTLGMTIFLLFPFTRLVHIWSAPIWYIGRRGYQVVRTRRTAQGGAHASLDARSIPAE